MIPCFALFTFLSRDADIGDDDLWCGVVGKVNQSGHLTPVLTCNVRLTARRRSRRTLTHGYRVPSYTFTSTKSLQLGAAWRFRPGYIDFLEIRGNRSKRGLFVKFSVTWQSRLKDGRRDICPVCQLLLWLSEKRPSLGYRAGEGVNLLVSPSPNRDLYKVQPF